MALPKTFQRTWGKTTGSAQPTLPLKALRSLPIALSSLDEQTQIVAEMERRLSGVEELEAVVSANLQRATRLRQSIP
jgi:type I restriction enzyme S subunit